MAQSANFKDGKLIKSQAPSRVYTIMLDHGLDRTVRWMLALIVFTGYASSAAAVNRSP
jgi:hypothetical protein